MKKLKLPKINLKFFFIFFIINFLLLLSFFYIYYPKTTIEASATELQKLSENVIKECKTSKHTNTCYSKVIPELMDSPTNLSMKQAFDVTDLVQKQDPRYGYCHVTGHNLSQKEVRKNPNDWKSVITKCPPAGCANGCIHGVFMEKFNAETLDDAQMTELSQEVKTVCEKNDIWNPTYSETTGCFHALGHAAMYLTQADVNRSLKFCYEVSNRSDNTTFFFSCYQGVFMQIFQPLEEEDQLLVSKIKPRTQQSAVKFCSNYPGWEKTACLNQMWPHFFKQFQQPDKLHEFCKCYDEQYKFQCYTTAFNILTSNLNLDGNFMLNYCSKLSVPSPGECLGQSAGQMLTIDLKNEAKAIELCANGQTVDPEGKCFRWLINTSNFLFRNPESEKPTFCNKLPSQWQQKCLES